MFALLISFDLRAPQDLLKVLSKLMTTALLFADHTIGFFEDCARATERDLETLQQQTQTTGNGHNTGKSCFVQLSCFARFVRCV